MARGFKTLPPSRRDKKQIAAHIEVEQADLALKYRTKFGLTVQEVIALAINHFAQSRNREPFLKARRERLVKRKRGLAQIQTIEKVVPSRAGKRRLAGWFDSKDVDRVNVFKTEVGVTIEEMIEEGLGYILTQTSLTTTG